MKEKEVFLENLEGWVETKLDSWRDHFEANYANKFDEYYRLWRGQWAAEDRTRESERSRIISPALQQAVESSVAEIEEATFGRGRWFDIQDDRNDQEAQDIVYLREQLYEDFSKNKVRKGVAECLINAAVFGTGIAEVVLEEVKEMKPATQPMMGGELQAIGVNIQDRTVCKLRPIMPQNFLIDPVATSIEEAMGVAIDEFVPLHYVEQMQEKGVFKDVSIQESAPDFDIEADKDLSTFDEDKVRLTKYYGLVPKHLLDDIEMEEDEEIVEFDTEEDEEDTYYVEAIVVLANGGILLKAERNPYMMQDRPVIAFPWDVVPARFWGRGVCEKGYNSQKALDAELRARIDALALTVHPMMAMDSTRIPRGSRFEVKPGKLILTNGDPREVLQPLNFGQVNQITFAQAASSLGIVAREYEVTQLVQLLQTMPADSPLYLSLIQSIIDNMNLSNREELINKLAEANQPNPEAQEAAQAAQQTQMAFQQSQTAALNGQAAESEARAQKIAVEAQVIPEELEISRIKAVTTNLQVGDQDDKEFERRIKVANTLLKEREVAAKEGSPTPQPQAPTPQLPAPPPQGLEQLMQGGSDGQQP